jgi:hypothetical protein
LEPQIKQKATKANGQGEANGKSESYGEGNPGSERSEAKTTALWVNVKSPTFAPLNAAPPQEAEMGHPGGLTACPGGSVERKRKQPLM